MDFLDPKRKKAHRRRLLIGYILMAITIAMAVWLLLISARGYWYDRKTGDIIQNGNIFVDSEPEGANIIINGKTHRDRTASRLVLPGGHQYNLKLTLDGYRDWNRIFSLEGGKVERITYPILLPKTLVTAEAQLYASSPGLASQSPNRRWLLVQEPGQSYVFGLYDLANPAAAPAKLTIPNNIMTEPTKPSAVEIVEWAGDDRHFLMKRTFNGTHEYLLIDSVSMTSSVNINTTLTISPTDVRLRDKKPDQLYLYNADGGIIRTGDLKNRTVSAAILSGVLAYKSYGEEIILFATPDSTESGKVNFRIREDDKATYLLKSVPEAPGYLLDIAAYDGMPYYAVGVAQDDVALLYRDPLPALKGQSRSPLLVSAVLRLEDMRYISFSPGSQFVAAQSGNKLIIFDIEGDRQYKLNLTHAVPLETKLGWMGPSHFVYNDKNMGYMIDFDGSNLQQVVPSLNNIGLYFAPDYKTVYTLAPSKAAGRTALTQTSLIIE